MDRRDELTTRVADLMADLDLDRRYFTYVDTCAGRPTQTTLRSPDLGAALTAAGLPVKYQRAEGFFQLFEKNVAPGINTGLNALLRGVKLELILNVQIENLGVGGTLHGLSRHIAETRDPTYDRTPPYPRIPITTKAELTHAATFTASLYTDIRNAITTQAATLTAP